MGPFIEGYRAWLAERGYTPGTIVNMLAMAGSLGRWMDARGIAPGDLDRAAIAEFRDAMRAAGRAPNGSPQQRLPQGTLPPVTDEFTPQINRYRHRQDVDEAALIRGAADPVGRQSRGRTPPQLPPPRCIQMTALDAGAERTELICGPHHPFKRGHHRRAVPPAAPVLADRDALNVTGTQRPARVQQAPLNHTAVTDQLALLHDQRMHAAEHVLEGVTGDAVKGSIHQAADSRPSAGIKVRSVGGSQLDHVRPFWPAPAFRSGSSRRQPCHRPLQSTAGLRRARPGGRSHHRPEAPGSHSVEPAYADLAQPGQRQTRIATKPAGTLRSPWSGSEWGGSGTGAVPHVTARFLVGWLVREGPLDELHLLIFPVVLGHGMRLFAESGDKVPLKLAGGNVPERRRASHLRPGITMGRVSSGRAPRSGNLPDEPGDGAAQGTQSEKTAFRLEHDHVRGYRPRPARMTEKAPEHRPRGAG